VEKKTGTDRYEEGKERGREGVGRGGIRENEGEDEKMENRMKNHWMMHRHPAVGSSPSPRAGLAPPPLDLRFDDFAFSSSSMTS